MDSSSSNIFSAFGPIGDLVSGLLGSNQASWAKNALSSVFGQLLNANQTGLGYYNQIFGPALSAALQNTNNLGGSIYGNGADQNGLLSLLQGQIGQGFGNLQSLFQNPQIQSALGNLGNLSQPEQGPLNDLLQQMGGLVGNSGQTETGNNALTELGKLGIGDNGQQTLLRELGSALSTNPGSYGQTNTTKMAQDIMGQGLATGGKTDNTSIMEQLGQGLIGKQGAIGQIPSLQAFAQSLMQNPNIGNIPNLTNTANNILNLNANGTPGQTPIGAAGEMASLQGFLSGGKNAASNYLLGRGENLSANNPVLPSQMVYDFATDQAARENLNAAATAREQSFARSGVTGPEVAAGSTNSDLAPYMDTALQNVAQAGQNALVQQQGLGLNQLGQGLGAVASGQGLQNQLLSLFGGNLTNLENAATGRLGTGGNIGLGAQSEANNVLGMGANTGLGAQSQANNLLGLGAGQLDTANSQEIQKMLGELGVGLQGGAQQTQNAATGAGILNQGIGTNISALANQIPFLQQQFSNLFNAGNQVQGATGLQGNLTQQLVNSILGQGNAMNSAYTGLLGQNQNLLGQLFGGYGQGLSSLLGLGGQGMGYANTAIGGLPHVFANTWSSAYNPLGTGIAGALSGLGNINWKSIIGALSGSGGGGGGGGLDNGSGGGIGDYSGWGSPDWGGF